jgi:diguanylate cyclase (GGDEF)-like protein
VLGLQVVADGDQEILIVKPAASHLDGRTFAQQPSTSSLPTAWDDCHRDELTGLFNRRYLSSCLSAALCHPPRPEGKLGLFFIDVDNFKSVNDRYGHVTGDRVLAQIAQLLRAGARPEDLLARYGGDEFVLLAENLPSPMVARRIARRLARSSRLALRTDDGAQLLVSTSVGFALHDDVSYDATQLISAADRQMYRVKQRRHRATRRTPAERKQMAVSHLAPPLGAAAVSPLRIAGGVVRTRP